MFFLGRRCLAMVPRNSLGFANGKQFLLINMTKRGGYFSQVSLNSNENTYIFGPLTGRGRVWQVSIKILIRKCTLLGPWRALAGLSDFLLDF